MSKKKKEKRYKLKNLYICKIFKVTDEEYYDEDYSTLIGTPQGFKILHRSFINYIDPLTKRRFKRKSNHIGGIYIKIEHNICDFFDIPDEILLRGDYLTLEEILEYAKRLKKCEQMVKEY